MRKILHFVILGVLVLFAICCRKDDIYDRPDWLAGKLYTQIQANSELSTFAQCIRRVGYDSVIDRSGSYTVFAPTNAAFELYFQEHPQYNTVDDIPLDELSRIVKYHIVQNPWSLEQLKQLDVYGWIDTLDLANDEPKGFKRETLLREENTRFGVDNNHVDYVPATEDRKLVIVDTTETTWKRRQTTDARKFVPFFYKEYMDIYDLNSDDYAFYFGRPFEQSKIYFVNAEISSEEIFAENGFVHPIDRVVEPLKNAQQLMSDESGDYSYTAFRDLINTFPEFEFNVQRTNDQPGADQGLQVDSLFDISYPELTFDIVNERTTAPKGASGLPSNVTIRYQHGLIAPTNEALANFEAEYFIGPGKWGSLQGAPEHLRRIVVNTHMAQAAIFPSKISQGFYNGEDDKISFDQSTIVQKQFASNCSFIGVNQVVEPRAFSSVTGPVYLSRGYTRAMYAIEYTGLLSALKRANNQYVFFVENDANLALDSSLIYDQFARRFQIFQVSQGSAVSKSVTVTDLRNLILNHTGLRKPTNIPRKEFIKNLAGNYIIWNNETNEVRGNLPSTFGYQGSEQVIVVPQKLKDCDNGTTYGISNWFNFSYSTIYSRISTLFPDFHNLLVAAGLADTRNERYTFMSDDDNYTVFAPSAAALAAYPYNTLTLEQKKKFLMMHFVQGSLIFTDGSGNPGYYETARIDEKSTQYTKIYTRIYLNPIIDGIEFRADDGSTYTTVNESANTNVMASRLLGESDDTYPTIVTNGVIHQIDKVLVFSDMDTE